MRRLLIAAWLAAGTATASDDQFLKGAELQAEIAKSCGDGCVTFNHEEAQTFQKEFQRIVDKARKEAFAEGVAAQRSACRSLL